MDLAELFLEEIKLHRAIEDLKQELESCKGYDRVAAYNTIDDCAMKYIYLKNLERFFKQ